MKTATAPSQSVSQLNSLLRGELSAIETYQNAILKTRKEHASEAHPVARHLADPSPPRRRPARRDPQSGR